MLHVMNYAWLYTSEFEGGEIRLDVEQEAGNEIKLVPLEGIVRITNFIDAIGYCKSDFVGMDAKQVFVPFTSVELKAECEGLGFEPSSDEWRLATMMTKTYANAMNAYSGVMGVPPPYGFDPEEEERKNAEILALLGED